MRVVEAVYKEGVFKPMRKDIKLNEERKVFVILPKEKKEEEIIKELRELKDVNYPEEKLDKVYYGRYSA